MKWDDDIHNYYEKLVVEHIDALELETRKSADFLADLSCLVLNQLPARYIRHEVDMEFYLDAETRDAMQDQVEMAITKALTELEDETKKRA